MTREFRSEMPQASLEHPDHALACILTVGTPQCGHGEKGGEILQVIINQPECSSHFSLGLIPFPSPVIVDAELGDPLPSAMAGHLRSPVVFPY